ncbi:hypothetical protein BT69DRAFT_1278373 [Atractiella rhizophila]|nr:hypothetical protein BT69DRAFT_1278373 [Atractiella rhizophila]
MVLWVWKLFSRILVWFESVAVPRRGDLKLEEEVTRFLSISIPSNTHFALSAHLGNPHPNRADNTSRE